MGKALIIKNVNFGANKLDTVTFVEPIPCTGITLNKASTTMSAVGSTETLVATVSPSDATDAVTWTSSNPNVVSVSNGVLTQTGVGTATITAACGTHTASCTVETVNTLNFMYWIGRQNYQNGNTQDCVFNQSSSGSLKYAAIQSDVQTPKVIWVYNYDAGAPKYPILLGNGADTLTISVPNTIRPTVWFTNSETACDYSIEHPTYADKAKVISGDSSAYDSSVSLGNRTLTIPEGADSIAMSLHCPSADITDDVFANVTIVASKSSS